MRFVDSIIITINCPICGKEHEVEVSENAFYEWQNGKCIQDAMPYLTADERELLISHTCGDCWAEMFSCIGGD